MNGKSMTLEELYAADPVLTHSGVIIIDEYDSVIFDDVYRNFLLWGRIDKRLAPGETTGGFDQTDIGEGRTAGTRSLGFAATKPTRVNRVRRTVKAIVADRQFTIFDRSLGIQSPRSYTNLVAKDVSDMYTACMRKWSQLTYAGVRTGNSGSDYDGLQALIGAGTDVTDATSIATGLDNKFVEMTNRADRDVMPTAIYANAKVVQMLVREFETVGDKLMTEQILVNGSPRQVRMLPTAVGMIPLFPDPFNATTGTGTTLQYPTFILTENLVSWQYVEVLGQATADPRTYEISLTNALDLQYKTVMFGAMELLGGTVHHARLNVGGQRTTIVSPIAA